MYKEISNQTVTKEILKEKLLQHVEQVGWCLNCSYNNFRVAFLSFFGTLYLFTLVSGVSMHIIGSCGKIGTQLYFAYYYLCIACSEELTVFVSWNQCDYENIWLETGTKVDVDIYVVQ